VGKRNFQQRSSEPQRGWDGISVLWWDLPLLSALRFLDMMVHCPQLVEDGPILAGTWLGARLALG
jgi:hypothetical protein